MTQQFKVLFALVALFFVSTFAVSVSPCATGNQTYVQPEDCVFDAIDPEGGNCWWAAGFMSCEIYAETKVQCQEYCVNCLKCLYDYGCCVEGNPHKRDLCVTMCEAAIDHPY